MNCLFVHNRNGMGNPEKGGGGTVVKVSLLLDCCVFCVLLNDAWTSSTP